MQDQGTKFYDIFVRTSNGNSEWVFSPKSGVSSLDAGCACDALDISGNQALYIRYDVEEAEISYLKLPNHIFDIIERLADTESIGGITEKVFV
jgi:hypothetical protein